MSKIPIAVIEGDGIGPEIMKATLQILNASGASLEIHPILAGERAFLKGEEDGLGKEAASTLFSTSALLKGPLSRVHSGRRVDVTTSIVSRLDLSITIQRYRSLFPFVLTKHPEMDVLLISGDQEDVRGTIEYRQTPNISRAQKIISTIESKRVIRAAFEYAKQKGRKKISCLVDDDIMPFSDGLFRNTFLELSQEYPSILFDNWMLDTGLAKMGDQPELFDVIVVPYLYGTLLSKILAQSIGSIALGASSHFGTTAAMFEPLHGPQMGHEGQDRANPSGLLLAAVEMLIHLNLQEQAKRIYHALLVTLEEGIHTYDLYHEKMSKQKVGTREFTNQILKNLGKNPSSLKHTIDETRFKIPKQSPQPLRLNRQLIGIDVYIHHLGPLELFFPSISHINIGPLRLKEILNKGLTIWPKRYDMEMLCSEQWVCRFVAETNRAVSQHDTIHILHAFDRMKIEVIKGEFLYEYDQFKGYG